LSGGEQQMLAIGRALMSRPPVVLTNPRSARAADRAPDFRRNPDFEPAGRPYRGDRRNRTPITRCGWPIAVMSWSTA